MKKSRGYEQPVQRDDSSVYDDEEDGGMLTNSRNPAVRARAYEGKQPHPARWVCATIFCTLFVVFLAVFLGSGTETGREVLRSMAQSGASDYKGCVRLALTFKLVTAPAYSVVAEQTTLHVNQVSCSIC